MWAVFSCFHICDAYYFNTDGYVIYLKKETCEDEDRQENEDTSRRRAITILVLVDGELCQVIDHVVVLLSPFGAFLQHLHAVSDDDLGQGESQGQRQSITQAKDNVSQSSNSSQGQRQSNIQAKVNVSQSFNTSMQSLTLTLDREKPNTTSVKHSSQGQRQTVTQHLHAVSDVDLGQEESQGQRQSITQAKDNVINHPIQAMDVVS